MPRQTSMTTRDTVLCIGNAHSDCATLVMKRADARAASGARDSLHRDAHIAACCEFIAAALAVNTATAQNSFLGLGSVSPDSSSQAFAMSADGSTVVGWGYINSATVSGQQRAIRWTRVAGMHPLFEGQLDLISAAFAVSGDGLSAGGWHAPTIIEEKAFSWSQADGESLFNTRSAVLGLSGDGTVGAGYVVQGRGAPRRAAMWTNGHLTFIDDSKIVGPGSDARAISADGRVIVGLAVFNGLNVATAYRWTAATGMQNLGYTGFGGPGSEADAVSANGLHVVGAWQNGQGGYSIAALWNLDVPVQVLGTLPGDASSCAFAVSDAGTTIVGTSGSRAFI
ncbi:MAG: hypothetical protein SFY96_10065 [Planctomycetota bacterium]|nr:hypothetical protein [Planctomycetota bacterium]